MNSSGNASSEARGNGRRFRVRGRHEHVHHGRVVNEPTLEAAAVTYLEHLPIRADGPAEISLIVHDVQSGP